MSSTIIFYYMRGYMFRPFNRSSSGLLTLRVNRRYVHVGVPVSLHW